MNHTFADISEHTSFKRTFLVVKKDEVGRKYISEVIHSDDIPNADGEIVEIPTLDEKCHIVL